MSGWLVSVGWHQWKGDILAGSALCVLTLADDQGALTELVCTDGVRRDARSLVGEYVATKAERGVVVEVTRP